MIYKSNMYIKSINSGY